MTAEACTSGHFPNQAKPPGEIPDDEHDTHGAAEDLTSLHMPAILLLGAV
jgi:hypothetical protein